MKTIDLTLGDNGSVTVTANGSKESLVNPTNIVVSPTDGGVNIKISDSTWSKYIGLTDEFTVGGVAAGPFADVNALVAYLADFFPEAGGGAGAADWNTLTNKPAIIGAGATAGAAQTAMGAGATGAALFGSASAAAAKTLLALNLVDNTSDANKPVSIAQKAYVDGRVSLLSASPSGVYANVQNVAGGVATPDGVILSPGTASNSIAWRTAQGRLVAISGVADTEVANMSQLNARFSAAARTAVAALTPIADPSTALPADIATLLNAVIAALKS